MFKFDTKALHKLLKNTYLNGIIKQVVLNVQNGVASIQTIDENNSLFISNNIIIDKDNPDEFSMGIKDLTILYKVINGLVKENITPTYTTDKEKRWFCINNPSKGRVKMLLIEPSAVKTNVVGGETKTKMTQGYENSVQLYPDDITNILYYINLFKNNILVFESRRNNLMIKSSELDNNQFTVKLTKPEKIVPDMKIQVNGNCLTSLLNQIKEDEEDIIIKFKEDSPLIIEQASFFWALSPIVDKKDEENE